MNQGNSRYHPEENDIYHDGCVLLHFLNSEQQWVAIFLAFQSQSWCTDGHGRPDPDKIDENEYPLEGCRPNVDYTVNDNTDSCRP